MSWQSLLSSANETLVIARAREQAFRGAIQEVAFGPIRAFKTTSTPHETVCGGDGSRFAASARSHVHVVFQLEGDTVIKHLDRDVTLAPGDWVISTRVEPFRLIHLTSTTQLMLLIPFSELSRDLAQIERMAGVQHSARRGMAKLFRDFVRSAYEEAREGVDERFGASVATTLLDLMRASLAHAGGGPVHPRQIFFDRVQQLIAERLRDPNLSVAELAGALRCSKRYIHMVFRQYCSKTVSDYILSQRLDACRRDIELIGAGLDRISSIAFSWGFNDPSYFSRAFRDRFGVSPSRWVKLSTLDAGTERRVPDSTLRLVRH